MTERTASGNIIERGFELEGGPLYARLLKQGYETFYIMADYYWGVINIPHRKIYTYAEGDTAIITAEDMPHLVSEVGRQIEWFKEHEPKLVRDAEAVLKKIMYPQEASNPPRGAITAYRPEDYEFFDIALKEAQEYGERYRIVQEKSGKYPDGTDRIIVSLFVEGGARGRAESAMRGGRQRHFGGKLHIETASYEGYESKSSNPPRGEEEREAIIYEEGQGFPDVGELVYDAKEGLIYKVKEITSGILTRQWEANRVHATLTYYGDPWSISEKKFEELRNVRIEFVGTSNPPRGER